MAPLPTQTVFVFGLAVSIASLLIESLQPFILVGVGILVYAGFRAIKEHKQTDAPKHTYNTKPKAPQQETENKTKRCYVCSAKNSVHANYCGHCGHKLT